MALLVPVSWGELVDKITILRIKCEKISDEAKLGNVRHELALLEKGSYREEKSEELSVLEKELRLVNESLWEIEDAIRLCEKKQDFGQRFIDLARSVYRNNDKRAALKYQINILLGSDVVEEKSYEQYD